jgi:hypothetical protein
VEAVGQLWLLVKSVSAPKIAPTTRPAIPTPPVAIPTGLNGKPCSELGSFALAGGGGSVARMVGGAIKVGSGQGHSHDDALILLPPKHQYDLVDLGAVCSHERERVLARVWVWVPSRSLRTAFPTVRRTYADLLSPSTVN